MRISPLPCSKELFPVGFRDGPDGEGPRPLPVCSYLLEALHAGGATEAFVVLGSGKWDIPAYLQGGDDFGLPVGYLVIRDSPGVPYTIDRAYPFVHGATVLFGFPDMVLAPSSTFRRLGEAHAEAGADVTLGLFPAERPETMDMVKTDETGAVRQILVKPAATRLRQAWVLAVWGPAFTEFLHDVVTREEGPARGRGESAAELHLGHVLQDAVSAGLDVRGVPVRGGRYRDIGTPGGLVAAWTEGTPPP